MTGFSASFILKFNLLIAPRVTQMGGASEPGKLTGKQMRLIASILMLIIAAPSLAQEIKLQCDLGITYEYQNGTRDKKTVVAMVDIFETPSYLSIDIGEAEPLLSISSAVRGRVISSSNTSDKNKWELNSESTDLRAGQPNSTRSVRVDRNTGLLAFREYFRRGLLTTTGSGYCTKVNDAVRKF